MAQPKKLSKILLLVLVVVGILVGFFLTQFLSKDTNRDRQKNLSSDIQPTATIAATDAEPREFLWQKQSSAQTGWITYYNPELGMQISVPEDYVVDASNPELLTMHPEYQNVSMRDGVSEQDMKLEIYSDGKNYPGVTVAAFYEEQKNEGRRERRETVSLNGMQAIHDYWTGLGDGETYFIVSRNHKIMLMKYPQETVHQAEFENILSTITFL